MTYQGLNEGTFLSAQYDGALRPIGLARVEMKRKIANLERFIHGKNRNKRDEKLRVLTSLNDGYGLENENHTTIVTVSSERRKGAEFILKV